MKRLSFPKEAMSLICWSWIRFIRITNFSSRTLKAAKSVSLWFTMQGQSHIMFLLQNKTNFQTTGFVDKSRDTLSADLLSLIGISNVELLKTILPHESNVDRKSTLGYVFSKQVIHLMDKLKETESHYIRCVKPNSQKQPRLFEPHMCHEQLKYSGVFEAVKIRKGGFPFRLKHCFIKQIDCFKSRFYGTIPMHVGPAG